jgi:hypothetical protein
MGFFLARGDRLQDRVRECSVDEVVFGEGTGRWVGGWVI